MDFKCMYNFSLTLANPNIEIKFDKHSNEIFDAINEYNEICLKRVINCKKLTLLEENIFTEKLIMSLESVSPIDKIGMAIRFFSQILIKNSEKKGTAFAQSTFNKQLFNITQIVSPQITQNLNTPIIKPSDIDDATLVKALIDYLLNKSDCSSTIYKKRVQALDAIKHIAIESGIIDLQENGIQIKK